MKKFIILLGAAFLGLQSFAQTLKASLGKTATENQYKILIKSDANINANISTLQFSVAIPTSVGTKPVVKVLSNGFAGSSWVVDEATELGYYHYMIQTPTSPITPTLQKDVEFDAIVFEVSGTAVKPTEIYLMTLPDGGAGDTQGKALFLCTSGDMLSNGSELYYAKQDVKVENKFSYDLINGNPGTEISYAVFVDALPVNFLSFYAMKSEGASKLVWDVENDINNQYFEIEKSTDGIKYNKIGTVPAKANGISTNTYEFFDKNFLNDNVTTVFYRIKQVDKDGTITYSVIRNLKLDKKTAMNLFPNPVRTSTKLSFDSKSEYKASLLVRDVTGKIVMNKQVVVMKGINNFDINLQNVASGEYNVVLMSPNSSEVIKLTKIN